MRIQNRPSFLLVLLFTFCAPLTPAQEEKLAREVTVDFDGKSLGVCLGFLADNFDLSILADPQVIQGKLEEQPQVTLKAKDISIQSLLTLLTQPHGLEFHLACGAIVITSAERAASLPRTVRDFGPNLSEKERAIQQKLAEVSMQFKFFTNTPFEEVIDFLCNFTGSDIVSTSSLASKKITPSTLHKMRADRALTLLAWAVGGELRFHNGTLQIVPANRTD